MNEEYRRELKEYIVKAKSQDYTKRDGMFKDMVNQSLNRHVGKIASFGGMFVFQSHIL